VELWNCATGDCSQLLWAPKTKTLQAQRGLTELLNLWSVYSIVETVSEAKVSQTIPGGWPDFVHNRSA